MFGDFRELDWRAVTSEIARLEEEKQQIEQASDQLRALQGQLETLEQARAETDDDLEKARDERSRLAERRERGRPRPWSRPGRYTRPLPTSSASRSSPPWKNCAPRPWASTS
ncbi:MAG: hypothetical protein U5L11_10575 [Arhodomonas sp.]|nr:hypothetical protein [Arhodomonas sp.]